MDKPISFGSSSKLVVVVVWGFLTTRPIALSGYGPIAHEAKPNGLLTRGP